MDGDQGGPLKAALTLRLLTGHPVQMAALQCVLEATPGYFQSVTGRPPGQAEAQSLLSALPPDKGYADKFLWGFYCDEALIGCADVIRGYPVPEKAVIGLLLLAEAWQRRGLGRAFALLLEQAIAAWPEITTLRIGVVKTNTGAHLFWRGLGFAETGEVKQGGPEWVSDVRVLEKPLQRASST